MNQLLPIIRRKRRAFLPVEDVPPMVVGNVEPPKVELTEPNTTDATDGTQGEARTGNENVSTSSESR